MASVTLDNGHRVHYDDVGSGASLAVYDTGHRPHTGYHRDVVHVEPIARPVPAQAIVAELDALSVTHVIAVPDTHQRTLLAELARQPRMRLVAACTEDEAIAINAGLWVGGQRPILSIQHVGLLAALNNLKALALDGRVPTCLLVGYFGREPSHLPRDDQSRAVRLIEPTLDAWGVAYFPLEGPADIGAIGQAYRHSQQRYEPAVVLIGAPTG